MRLTLRILAFLAFVGGGIWIWHLPRDIEPYVTSVTLLAGFLATFAGRKEKSSHHDEPDVIAYLVEFGRLQHRLVVENRGVTSAFDVTLHLHLAPGQETPLLQGDDSFPIHELYAHDERQIIVGLTFGSGTEFDATWTWKNAKGRQFERRNTIALRR